jgi:hypothetical protein
MAAFVIQKVKILKTLNFPMNEHLWWILNTFYSVSIPEHSISWVFEPNFQFCLANKIDAHSSNCHDILHGMWMFPKTTMMTLHTVKMKVYKFKLGHSYQNNPQANFPNMTDRQPKDDWEMTRRHLTSCLQDYFSLCSVVIVKTRLVFKLKHTRRVWIQKKLMLTRSNFFWVNSRYENLHTGL